MHDHFDAQKQLLSNLPPTNTTFPVKMASEAHLSVLSRLIDEVQSLRAERETISRNQGEPIGEVSEKLLAATASKAREGKEAYDKLMQDAFAVFGVRVTQVHRPYQLILTS